MEKEVFMVQDFISLLLIINLLFLYFIWQQQVIMFILRIIVLWNLMKNLFYQNYLYSLENIKKFDNLVIESPIIISSDLRESIGDVLCKVSLNKEIEVYF